MNAANFKEKDFDHPSGLFILEDMLKGVLGCALLYNPYFKTLGIKGDENVLDFGCGGATGSKCLLAMLNKGGRLTCVDSSAYWINKARKRLAKYGNVDLKCGEIGELDIPESSFDIISVIHVIHDISPEKREGIVKTLSRKLKDDGKMFIREPLKASHGMPVSEIRSLMAVAGLKEAGFIQAGSEFKGEFRKG